MTIRDHTTKQKGALTELRCIIAFYENGYNVSIPYCENARYDFIADINGKLIRVQVKTSSTSEKYPGIIVFSCQSVRTNASGNHKRSYTEKEIDYFATYWDGQCYLIPVQECHSAKVLRFDPPKNGQTRDIHLASDYELSKQLKKIAGERDEEKEKYYEKLD